MHIFSQLSYIKLLHFKSLMEGRITTAPGTNRLAQLGHFFRRHPASVNECYDPESGFQTPEQEPVPWPMLQGLDLQTLGIQDQSAGSIPGKGGCITTGTRWQWT